MKLLIACALLVGITEVAAAGPFTSPGFRSIFLAQDLPQDHNQVGMFVGDTDHDGRPNVVIVYWGGGTRTLSPKPDGWFEVGPFNAVPVDFVHPTNQGGMYDFDGDGELDFALLSGLSGHYSIVMYKGDGAGHFAAPRTIVASLVDPEESFEDAVFGEFTGDGWIDVATTRRKSGGIYDLVIFAGTASGMFQEVQVYKGTPSPYNTNVHARDLDRDGRTDLVWSGSHSLRVYRGQPGGGLAPPIVVPLPAEPFGIGAGDFDGDGTLDLVARAGASPGYWICRGNGSGGYDEAAFSPLYWPQNVLFRCADTDGDGRDEILTTESFATVVGSIDAPSGSLKIPVRGAGFWEPADMDGDGRADFVLTDGPGFTTVYSSPIGAGPTGLAIGATPTQVVLADLDRDGNLDAVTPDSGSDQVTILWGDGAGGFPARTDLAVGHGPDAVAIAQLDSDSWPDLVVGERTAGTLGVILGLGNRTFGANASIPSGTLPRGVAVGDLTGDGFADAAVAFDLLNQVKIFPGDGAGHLGAAVPLSTGSAPQAPTIVDLDHDGRLDLVYALRVATALGIRLGQDGGTLGTEILAPAAGKPTRLAAFDVDHDGLLDLASIGDLNATVRIARNAGDGTFESYAQFVPKSVLAIATGDFDADGIPEIASVQSDGATATIGIDEISGPGSLVASSNFFGGDVGGSGIAAGDLDHDGRPDLVVTSISESRVSVLLNRHTGPILAVTPVPPGRSRLRFASRMPARGEFALAYDAPSADPGVLRVLSARGTVVFQERIQPNAAGTQLLRVAPNGLRAGVYWAEVRQGSYRDAVKFVLLP